MRTRYQDLPGWNYLKRRLGRAARRGVAWRGAVARLDSAGGHGSVARGFQVAPTLHGK